MISLRRVFCRIAALMVFACFGSVAQADLTVGVTLHPYYSYVANIIGARGKVVPLIPEGFNPHAYEPRAQDIRAINDLDVLVLNDIGHDIFARKMVEASENRDIPIIQANRDVPLLSSMGVDQDNREGVVNPHTFISISAAMIQVNTIASELAKLDPEYADEYLNNARQYNKRLRKMRSDALRKIRDLEKTHLKIATVHGGYDYLFREFGLEVSAVIEPAHGVEPSPAQLRKVVDLIVEKGIDILFIEQNNPSPYSVTIAKEANIRLARLSHITHGSYHADTFEKGMAFNLEQLVQAIIDSQPSAQP